VTHIISSGFRIDHYMQFVILFEVGHHNEVEIFRFETDPTNCILDVRSVCSMVKVSA